MAKHFILRKDITIEVSGKTLYRIEATKDLENLFVKKGDLGGFIEREENVTENAWVYNDAKVFDNARIFGDARVSGHAKVFGNAWIFNHAEVSGHAKVFGNAKAFGYSYVTGHAQVSGHAEVFDNACIFGEARMYEHARAFGYSKVSGKTEVCGNVDVFGQADVIGDRLEKKNDLINITSNVDSYNITITPKHIKIGCQYHAKTAWFGFTDDQIRKMDGDKAVERWHVWKPILQQLCNLREE